MVKMWLDDYRDPEKLDQIGWTWVKTAPEAIALLKTGKVKVASLDHDLGLMDCGTGYDVVLFLEENPDYWPEFGVRVHSRNPVAAKRMRTVIERHYGVR
jgi:hypothetical protein